MMPEALFNFVSLSHSNGRFVMSMICLITNHTGGGTDEKIIVQSTSGSYGDGVFVAVNSVRCR